MPPTLEDPYTTYKVRGLGFIGKPDSVGLVDVPLIDYRIQLGFTSIDHRQKTRQWLALGPDPKAKN